MFTDTHCHLFEEYYPDIEKIIRAAYAWGVKKLIVAATDIKTCMEVLNLSEHYENVYICLGIHPESSNDDFDALRALVMAHKDNPKLVGIGEIGLDYYYTKETREEQKELFWKQLQLAEELNLPVVVHSREATLDTLEILKKFHGSGIIHCFTGSLETANEYIKLGFYLGVGGVMTFKNAKLKDIIKQIPLNKIVLETDSPYLTPEPFRKNQNEPKYILEIAKYLAALKEVDLEDVSKITEANVQDIFDI